MVVQSKTQDVRPSYPVRRKGGSRVRPDIGGRGPAAPTVQTPLSPEGPTAPTVQSPLRPLSDPPSPEDVDAEGPDQK